MKLLPTLAMAALLCLGGLAACGGGGGDPGTCFGSDEVCDGNGNSGGDQAAPGGVPVSGSPPPSGGDVTCASFASPAEAQAALAGGARQLDPDNDGIACNE